MAIQPYIAPLFPIVLYVFSPATSKYIKWSIERYVADKPNLGTHRLFITNVALDWSTKANYINSVLASIIAILVIAANDKNAHLALYSVVPIVIVFAITLLWMLGKDPGEMVAAPMNYIPKYRVSQARFLSTIMLAQNVGMLIVIYYSRR